MAHTLKIGDASAMALPDLGITGAILNGTHLGGDTLTLTTAEALRDAALIPAFAKCELRDESGAVRFIGWLDQAPKSASPGETTSYVLSGPWRWLMRAYFKADKKIGEEVLTDASGLYRLGGALSDGSEAHVQVADQLLTLLNFARTESGNAFNIAELPEGFFEIEIPWEDRADDLVSDSVSSLLSYAPTAAVWWTYPAGVPTLNFIDTAAGGDPDNTLDGSDLTALPALNPRYDLLRERVEVIYLTQDSNGQTTRTVRTVESAGDAGDLGSGMTQVYSFALQEGEPLPEAGLETKLAAWHQRLHIETTGRFNSIDWSRLPGQTWTFGGPFIAYDGKIAVAQAIVRDLMARTETVTLGPPPAPSTYRLSKRTSPGPSSGPEQETGTLTVTIKNRDGDVIEKATWSAGGESAANQATLTFAPGGQTVSVFVPVDYEAPDPVEVTIVKDAETTTTITCDRRTKLTLQDDDQTDPTKVEIDTAAIVSIAPPEGKAVIRIVKENYNDGGDVKYGLTFRGDLYTEPEP